MFRRSTINGWESSDFTRFRSSMRNWFHSVMITSTSAPSAAAYAFWQVVMPGMHPGYIDWQRFEANQRRLTDNARAFGNDRRSGPVREGPALLQGRVLCGLCGERMGVRYAQEHGQTVPVYICQTTLVRRGGPVCQRVPGKVVDPAVAALLVELPALRAYRLSLADGMMVRT